MRTFRTVSITLLMVIALSSCTYRLVDFTVISSKNVNLNIDRSLGKKVKGDQAYFLGLGWNIKDAMDNALESAGNEYDMLVDGVVRYGNYPFVLVVTVEGTAISTSQLKAQMGEEGFQNWLDSKNSSYSR